MTKDLCVVCGLEVREDEDAISVPDNRGGQNGSYAHRKCWQVIDNGYGDAGA
jgi:hypothetical protein